MLLLALVAASLHSAAALSALVGNKAPEFKAVAVHNHEFKEVSLESFRGKYVVGT